MGIGIIIFDACFSNYLNSQTIVGERTDIFFLCCLNNKSLNVCFFLYIYFANKIHHTDSLSKEQHNRKNKILYNHIHWGFPLHASCFIWSSILFFFLILLFSLYMNLIFKICMMTDNSALFIFKTNIFPRAFGIL